MSTLDSVEMGWRDLFWMVEWKRKPISTPRFHFLYRFKSYDPFPLDFCQWEADSASLNLVSSSISLPSPKVSRGTRSGPFVGKRRLFPEPLPSTLSETTPKVSYSLVSLKVSLRITKGDSLFTNHLWWCERETRTQEERGKRIIVLKVKRDRRSRKGGKAGVTFDKWKKGLVDSFLPLFFLLDRLKKTCSYEPIC